ncbi:MULTISPECIES: hypothetical protein [unclassified Halomonas]|uniref:phage tail terminator protein n=1 Tax=unclassified Halomonas TaxID=2609666 RepID=UPI0020A190BA|nr:MULTISPECIES: hypothetical protein [unclassified Halomonas]MCP1314389.1 hypothetical protein [Halomonas sp. 707D7]MCP1326056.1 hypothetical protein [Halomonas sp. 707D4]
MNDRIIEALSAAGITAASSSEADPSRADTVPGLVMLVDPVVEQALWPLNLPSEAPPTNGVYNLAGQSAIEVDGYRLGRVDTYVLSLRSPTFDPLRRMTTELIERVAAQSGTEGWEITDAATDYEYDQRQYRAHFELEATSLAMAAPALPAAFVHPVQATADPNVLGTMDVRQTVTEHIAVVLVAEQSDVDAQRRAISEALLGLESPADAVAPLEYGGGQRVAVSGSHVYWRELYRYDRLMRS